jgi:hypothetical protein
MSKAKSDLIKNNPIFFHNDCAYFDGGTTLQYANTQDQFETGPFSVYIEWVPENTKGNAQQIVGHYNWEFLQNNDSVEFAIGRMNNRSGGFYSLKYPINGSFFGKKHSAIAIYYPKKGGYISLYVDNDLAGLKDIKGDIISASYNEQIPLSFGKSSHYQAPYYRGCIQRMGFVYHAIPILSEEGFLNADAEDSKINIIGDGKLNSIIVYTKK